MKITWTIVSEPCSVCSTEADDNRKVMESDDPTLSVGTVLCRVHLRERELAMAPPAPTGPDLTTMADQVQSLQDAVNQLVLDALMGGM